MNKYRENLWLKSLGLSDRSIAQNYSCISIGNIMNTSETLIEIRYHITYIKIVSFLIVYISYL